MNSRSTRNGPSRSGAALIHRGPQALNVASANYAAQVHAPNAALLIDFDNVTMGIRSDLGKELRTLLGSDIIKGKVAVQRAYADWRRYPQYMVPLAESSIDTIQASTLSGVSNPGPSIASAQPWPEVANQLSNR